MNSQNPHLLHPKYRPDIDGLRAIAILIVLLYHAFPEWVSGGFIGVDVFFVISGYLISTIIFENIAQHRFRFTEFYLRRINRIFPALFLVLLASYVFGWLNLLADDFAQLGKHIAGGAGFISNLILWRESGYFDKAADLKPLLHLWSLGIEEQFYIFWPIFICFLSRWPKKILPVMLAVASISFVLNIAMIDDYRVATFYLPLTRFWELLLGSLVAYGVLNFSLSKHVSTVQKDIASVIGLGLIGFATFYLNQKSLFPAWWALLPTLGAVLMIAAGPTAWLNRTILSARIMVWIGLISFPLYLWHWPLLTFARMQEGDALSIADRTILMATAIALSWLTYRFVERPIRFITKYRTQKNIALVMLMILVGYLGYNCFDRKGMEFRHRFFIKEFSSYTFDKVTEQRQHTCFLMDRSDDLSNFSKVCIHEDRPFKVVLWGDSHGGAVYPGFSELERQKNQVGVTQFTVAGCGGLLPGQRQSSFCRDANILAFQEIIRIKPNVVIIYKDWHPIYFPEVKETLQKLIDANIKVIVIGPTPHWTPDLPMVLYRFWKKYKTLPPMYSLDGVAQNVPLQEKSLEAVDSLDRNEHLGPYYSQAICNSDGCSIPRRVVDADLRKLVQSHGGIYYSAYDRFCNKDGCLNRIPGTENALTTLDEGHITPAAARYLVQDLRQAKLDHWIAK